VETGLIIAPRCSQKTLSDRVANYSNLVYIVLKQPPTLAAEWGRVSILEIEGLGGGIATYPRIAPAFS
jgi:hypothetical protein